LYRGSVILPDGLHTDTGAVQVKDTERRQSVAAWIECRNRLVGIDVVVVDVVPETQIPDMRAVIRGVHPGIDSGG